MNEQPRQNQRDQAVINGFYHYLVTNDTSRLFEAIFKFAKSRLTRVDRSYGDAGSCGNSDDLAQDVCVKVWEKFNDFEGTGEEFVAWLSKVVNDKRIDATRQRIVDHREVSFFVEELDEDGNAEEVENPAIYKSIFNDGAFEIPESVQGIDREICKWLLDGKSQAEVAKRLGMSHGAVRTRTYELRKRLTLERQKQCEEREENDKSERARAIFKTDRLRAQTEAIKARTKLPPQDEEDEEFTPIAAD